MNIARGSRTVVDTVEPTRPARPSLIERARAGDQLAFEMLVQGRLERLLRLALSILRNESDARDAVQDSCLQAWRELPRLRDDARFDAWLWRITLNTCRMSIRRRRRTEIHEIEIATEDQDPRGIGPERPFVEVLADRDAIRRAFLRLDPERRTVLVLHHVEGRSVAEIADLLGVAEGTAKSRLFKARRALELALEAER